MTPTEALTHLRDSLPDNPANDGPIGVDSGALRVVPEHVDSLDATLTELTDLDVGLRLRIARLEAIVNALAAGHPLAPSEIHGDPYCVLCASDETPGGVEHEPDCPWRRAHDYVAAPDTEGAAQP